jgi:hypothetical protein
MTTGLNQTESTQSLTSMLYLLRTLTEPAFVVHVGAGRGVGELHTWHSWALPKALIVDADVNRLGWAQQLCVQKPAWKVAATVISNGGSEAPYHLASNPDEDSLVPMQSLTGIWANIRAVKVQTVATLSLDQLLSAELVSEQGQHSARVWCLIDCLPADLILLGAEHSLANMSVVVARVILTNHQSAEPVGLLSSVSPYLEGKGFKCLTVLETTHPSIGYSVFVRDYKATHEEYAELVKAQLQTERLTIAQQNEKLSEQRLQLDRLVVDRDAQLDTVTSQAKTIEAQLLEIEEVKQQLIRMEAVVAESDQGKLALQGRQEHLHDDLVRAEAQIDLIKELMFSSPQLKG